MEPPALTCHPFKGLEASYFVLIVSCPQKFLLAYISYVGSRLM